MSLTFVVPSKGATNRPRSSSAARASYSARLGQDARTDPAVMLAQLRQACEACSAATAEERQPLADKVQSLARKFFLLKPQANLSKKSDLRSDLMEVWQDYQGTARAQGWIRECTYIKCAVDNL